MLVGVVIPRGTTTTIAPGDFVHKLILSKEFIQDQPDLAVNSSIDMDDQAPAFAEQTSHEGQPFVHHLQIRVEAAPPGIAVRLLLND